ncbi:MAG: MFS transporter [Anaerolineaceae bacterium]|nr:MFS transporter [Anaerolineaceae bacterium]
MQTPNTALKTYKQGVLAFSLFFALFYGAIGIILPFLNIHFRQIGFSGVQISSLLVLGLIIQISMVSQLGFWFDNSPRKRIILTFAVLALALTMAFLPIARHYLPILILYVMNYTIGMITGSVAVNLSYQAGTHPSGGTNRFGSMRLWGSVGFSVMALLGGILMEKKGILLNDFIYILLQLSLAAVIFWVIPQQSFAHEGAADSPDSPSGFKQVIKMVFNNRYLWMTVLALAMTDTLNDGIRAFEPVFMKELGISTAVIGLVSTLGALVEIPVLFWGGRILEKLGTNKLVIAVIAFDLIRRFFVWLLPMPGVVMAASILNAVSFPVRLLVTIYLVNTFIPKRFTTTANGFISVALYGLGYIFSNAVCGLIYDYFGPRQNYLFWSALAFLALLLAVTAGKPPQKQGLEHSLHPAAEL